MTIEIRELHVRVNVSAEPAAKRVQAEGSAGAGPDPRASRAGEDELLGRCVEQVLELLRNRTER